MKRSRYTYAGVASLAMAAAFAAVSASPVSASPAPHAARSAHGGGSTAVRPAAVRPAPFTVGAPGLAHRPNGVGSGFAESSKWSGWVDTGEQYTWVTSTWNVPSVSCAAGENSSSFVWDGLDGYGNSTVEQVGTYQDCKNGAPNYGAWWEMWTSAYGSPAVPLSSPQPSKPDGISNFEYWGDSSSYPVRPGDTMVGYVSNWGGAGTTYSVYVINETENWYFLAEVTPPSNWRPSGSANGISADWIVELPTNWVGTTLSHYSTVTFNNAEAEGNGTEGPINAFPNNMIWMTSTGNSNGFLMALTSFALSSNGESFNDGWVNA